MKLGNIDFKEGLGKEISYLDFIGLYSGTLKNHDIRQAYIKLGGTFNKKKKVKVKEEVKES